MSSPREMSEMTRILAEGEGDALAELVGAVREFLNHADCRLGMWVAFQLVKLWLPPKVVRSNWMAVRCEVKGSANWVERRLNAAAGEGVDFGFGGAEGGAWVRKRAALVAVTLVRENSGGAAGAVKVREPEPWMKAPLTSPVGNLAASRRTAMLPVLSASRRAALV